MEQCSEGNGNPKKHIAAPTPPSTLHRNREKQHKHAYKELRFPGIKDSHIFVD